MIHDVQMRVLDARLGRDFPLPDYATAGSAGMDLRAMIDAELTLAPGFGIVAAAHSVVLATATTKLSQIGSARFQAQFMHNKRCLIASYLCLQRLSIAIRAV